LTDLIIGMEKLLDTGSGYPHDVLRVSCCLPPERSPSHPHAGI